MTRRNVFTAALAAPFTMAAAAIAPLRNTKAPGVPVQLAAPPVTQAELQAVVDSWNHTELLAADIRRRLESGSGMERGALGVTTVGAMSHAWYREHGGIGEATGIDESMGCGLGIEPVENLAFYIEMVKQHPNPGEYVII